MFERVTYLEVIQKGLAVMDSTAISLCNGQPHADHHLQYEQAGEYRRAVMGEKVGSTVTANERELEAMTTISNSKEAMVQARTRMEKAVEDFRKELASVRTGRAMSRCSTTSAWIITARRCR